MKPAEPASSWPGLQFPDRGFREEAPVFLCALSLKAEVSTTTPPTHIWTGTGELGRAYLKKYSETMTDTPCT